MAYLRTRVIGSFGALCAGALVLAACSGKVLSLGTNSTASQEVAPSAVSGSVAACADGSAHPNVCCTAGPNQAGSCVVYPQAPFTPCDPGATTYPDPRSCCSLDGSGTCSAPPAGGTSGGGSAGGGSSVGSGGGGSGGTGCSYACPPGWYSPDSSGTCCQTDSSGATTCTASGGVDFGGPACSGSCTCPACPDDSGTCPPCSCPPPGSCPTPPTACGSCPPGWQSPQGQPDLCCTTDANGVIECFSQAFPPGQGGSSSTDAGAGPSSGSCGASVSTDGAVGPCGCDEQTGGHTYSVNCDPGTNVCTCSTDNGAPTGSFPDDGNTCGDPATLFSSCGFPTN
jgi:hypothetical protein